MSKVIRIDQEVWEYMQKAAGDQNKPFTSPNNVLRHLLLGEPMNPSPMNTRAQIRCATCQTTTGQHKPGCTRKTAASRGRR